MANVTLTPDFSQVAKSQETLPNRFNGLPAVTILSQAYYKPLKRFGQCLSTESPALKRGVNEALISYTLSSTFDYEEPKFLVFANLSIII